MEVSSFQIRVKSIGECIGALAMAWLIKEFIAQQFFSVLGGFFSEKSVVHWVILCGYKPDETRENKGGAAMNDLGLFKLVLCICKG